MKKKLLQSIALLLCITMSITVIDATVFAAIIEDGTASVIPDNGNAAKTPSEQLGESLSEPEDSIEDVVILEEIEEKREESVKHFLLRDKSIQAIVYPHPVHYQISEEEWEDIDNTLVSEKAQDSEDMPGFVTKANDFQVKFAEKTDGNQLVTIEQDKYALSFKPYDPGQSLRKDRKIIIQGKQKALHAARQENREAQEIIEEAVENTDQGVTYEDVFPAVDFDYQITGKTLKDNIIIKERQEEYVYQFEISSSNLRLTLDEKR